MAIYHSTCKVTDVFRNGSIDRVHLGSWQIFPDAAPEIQWLYTTDTGGVTLHLYLGTQRTVHIPPSIDGVPVTALSPAACCGQDCTAIHIPASVTLLA